MAGLAQPRRHLEPVNTGKLNIEQDKLRPQPLRLGDGRLTINGLAHDLDPVRLKQLTGNLPETLMIVDDQDGERHQTSVPSAAAARTRANPCLNQPAADWMGFSRPDVMPRDGQPPSKSQLSLGRPRGRRPWRAIARLTRYGAPGGGVRLTRRLLPPVVKDNLAVGKAMTCGYPPPSDLFSRYLA